MKYSKERDFVLQQKQKLTGNEDDKLLQTLLLTEKRILKLQQVIYFY